MTFINFTKNISAKIVLFFSLAIFAFISLLNYVGIVSFQGLLKFSNISVFLMLIIISLLLVIPSILLYKVKKNNLFIFYLFLFTFAIRLIWVLTIDSQPISDFKVMYEGALDIINGDVNSLLNSYYFNTWVYQLGFTMYLSIILKLVFNSLLGLKIVNTIIMSFIPIIIYLITKKLIAEKHARIPAILYAIYVSSIINSSVLTNQNISTVLFYLGLYFLISDIKFKWILVGLTMGIGNIIRPEGSVILIAIFLFTIFKDITDIKKVKRNIFNFIGIVIIFFIVTECTSLLILKSGFTTYPLTNRDPLWKFTCGINPETNGTYSENDLIFLGQFEDRNEGHKILLTERLTNPVSLTKTVLLKNVPMWASNDTSISFAFTENVNKNNLYEALVKLEKIQYIFFITMAFLSIIYLRKSKYLFSDYYLFLIIFIGYFLAHLMIEVQPRYRYFAIPSILIISSYSFSKLIKARNL